MTFGDSGPLRGRVAVVAGATRGAGRGIALALGEAGATVVCTGRTSRVRKIASDYHRGETIEETAELVTSLGGKGVAIAIDHLVPDDVKDLADRLKTDYGRIDILVNDIWGGETLKGGPSEWNTPVWEHDLDKGMRILRLAVDTSHRPTLRIPSRLVMSDAALLPLQPIPNAAGGTRSQSVLVNLHKSMVSRT